MTVTLHWVFFHNWKKIHAYDSYSSQSLFTQLEKDTCIWQLLFTESFYTTAKRYMYMTVTLHWVFLHNCKEIHVYDSYSSLSLFTQLQRDTCIWQLLFTESFYTTAKRYMYMTVTLHRVFLHNCKEIHVYDSYSSLSLFTQLQRDTCIWQLLFTESFYTTAKRYMYMTVTLHWVFLHNCKEIHVYDSYSSRSPFTQLQRDTCIWQLLFTESFYTTAKRYMYMTVTLHWVFLHNCKEIHVYDSYSSLSLFTQLQRDTCIWQLLFTESFYTTAKRYMHMTVTLHWVFLHNCKQINVYDSYSSPSHFTQLQRDTCIWQFLFTESFYFTQLQRDTCIWQLLFTESFYTTAKRYMHMTVTLHWVFLHNCKQINVYDSYSSPSHFTQLQRDTCIWQFLFTESFYTTAKRYMHMTVTLRWVFLHNCKKYMYMTVTTKNIS